MANRAALKERVDSQTVRNPGKKNAAVAPKHQRLLLFLMPSAVLIAIVIYAHIRVVSAGEDYTGILAPIDRVFDLVFAFALVSSTFCAGRALSNLLSLSFSNLAEEFAFSVLLGTGAVGLFILSLGFAGLLKPLPVSALFVLLMAVTYREVVRLYKMIGEMVSRARKSRATLLSVLLFLALVVLLACRAAEPPYAADDAICHLAVPKLFVQAGGIKPLYDNFASHMPLLNHMLYIVCLLGKSDISTRLFNLSLALTTSVMLYGFCARFLTRATGWLAMFGFFGAGMITEVAITNRIDITVAGMLFGATYAMVVYFEEDRNGWLWASALLAGISLSIKYTAAAWIAMMGVMFIYESLVKKRHKVSVVLMRGLIFTLITMAIVSPWLIKNYIYFNNPVYPFRTGEVADYGPTGVRYFTAEDEQKMDTYFEQSCREQPQSVANIEATMSAEAAKRIEHHPFRFWEIFTNSDLYNMGDESNHSPNYLFLITPLFLFLPKRRWLVWLSIFSIGFYLFVASSSWIARYLVPIYPALTVIAAYVLTTLAERLRDKAPIARLLPVTAVATAVVSTAFVFGVQIYKAGGISFLTGQLSRRDFLQAVYYYPAIDYVNQNAPKAASVLMMGVQTGYHLEHNYLADAAWDSVQWQRLMLRNNSVEEINEDLKRQGVQYVIFSPGLYKFIAKTGREGSGPAGTVYSSPFAADSKPDYRVQMRNWATFELYRSKFLELKYEVRDFYVFKIK